MRPKQNLFELIKSLSKSEKRYFKMYVSLQKGKKTYLKLFKEIDSQIEFNEKEIKEKYKNDKFVKQLTFTKNYLYKLLLRSLIAYENDKSIDTRIIELINAGKVLLRKGLIRQYFENLNYALKISLTYERFNYCLQILELKNVYTKITGSPQDNEGLIEQIESVIKKINNFHEYNIILSRLIDLYRTKGKIRNKNLKNIISETERLPLLKDSTQALSHKATENYYFIHQLISDFKGDDELIYKYCTERFNVICTYPEPFMDMSINYLHDILTYMLSYSARKNDQEKFYYYMNFLNSLPIESKADEISLFFVKTYINNVTIIVRKDWEEGIRLIPDIKTKLKEYHENLEGDKELLILYQTVVMLMMSGRYSEALDELNNLLGNSHLKLRPELEWYLKLLNVIIHYELKNYKLLSYLLISTYRYLYKKKNLFKLEKILLNFIRRLPGVISEEQLKQLLLALRKELIEIKDDHFEKNAFKYFDFIYWIDMKIK